MYWCIAIGMVNGIEIGIGTVLYQLFGLFFLQRDAME